MLNQIARSLLRLRLKLLKSLDPVKAQARVLAKLLRLGKECKFFKEHGLSDKMSVNDYQKAVPIRNYEAFWEEYLKPNFPVVTNVLWPGTIRFYSWTSGTTTGVRKYIPYNSLIKANYTLAGIDMLAFHYLNKPDSRLFSGKVLSLTASESFEEVSEGILVGEVSGFSTRNIPFFLKQFKLPPPAIAEIKDWHSRVEEIVKTIENQRITGIGGIPSWLLVFFERLGLDSENEIGFLAKKFPNLELLIHGGVNFEPYYERFRRLIFSRNIDFREIYPASEGFIAVADKGFGDGLFLLCNHLLFFEFIPLSELGLKNPTRLWLQDVELNTNYAIVITNGAGFWSYLLGDTVKFVSLKPPRILITGRTKHSLSAFGEHLIGEEIEKAVSKACSELKVFCVDFCVFPQFFHDKPGFVGNHHFIIELHESKPGLSVELAKLIDKFLLELNDDYSAHRADGCGIDLPTVTVAPKNFFQHWLASQNKIGEQFKVPRVVDTATGQSLINFMSQFE